MAGERNERPARHDQQSVVACALRLLDYVGLPDLSMRRLASELDVQPSALYWHFDSKQQLLAAVADCILASVAEPAPETPVETAAQSILDALLTYRDGAEVVMSTYALRLGAHRGQHALLTVLDGDASTADALFEFILGHATLLQQRMHAQSIGAVDPDADDPSARADDVFAAGIRAFSRSASLRF